jgi:hypothetical protein
MSRVLAGTSGYIVVAKINLSTIWNLCWVYLPIAANGIRDFGS